MLCYLKSIIVNNLDLLNYFINEEFSFEISYLVANWNKVLNLFSARVKIVY
jgi:hypothetical protein